MKDTSEILILRALKFYLAIGISVSLHVNLNKQEGRLPWGISFLGVKKRTE